ncbi:L,D-transpeptidase family protein [Cohaesibacter celericrescens]|uniref:L,D-transpeptidase family protein n=1 Tax=Cohaesibacter celericrescens TaxID=2067669 RepID=UPI0035625003
MITIKKKPLSISQGHCITGSTVFACALGQTGQTAFKQEGDGATPLTHTRPLYGFYRPDRESKPRSTLPFIPISKSMGWCDAIDHPSYNRRVRLPFGASCEAMWRDDSLYDLVVVLDINITQRQKGRGSALFMHVAREGYKPTEGCIALAKQDLRLLLQVMTTNSRIQIIR